MNKCNATEKDMRPKPLDNETRRKMIYFAAAVRHIGGLMTGWKDIDIPWDNPNGKPEDWPSPGRAAVENIKSLEVRIHDAMEMGYELPSRKSVNKLLELLILAYYELRQCTIPAELYLHEENEDGAVKACRDGMRRASRAASKAISQAWPRLMCIIDRDAAESGNILTQVEQNVMQPRTKETVEIVKCLESGITDRQAIADQAKTSVENVSTVKCRYFHEDAAGKLTRKPRKS